MRNILYIPLDERPCNYQFMPLLAKSTDYNIIVPPLSLLGSKKDPADTEKLWDWIFQNAGSAEGAIFAIDTLVYGGIIPSRLHYQSIEQCQKKLENLKKLKSLNNAFKIYAFSLIMRCPSYSSSDEEPDYYESYGKDIFQYGFIRHKNELGLASPDEVIEFDTIKKRLPDKVLGDYCQRRAVNRDLNKLVIDLVNDGIIDFLVIPQDDSAPFGFTAIDQQFLRKYIAQNNLNLKIYMYPGADEVGMVLFTRMVYSEQNSKLNVYVRFPSINSPYITPLYEDRLLYESIKYQLLCAGGFICQSLADADIVLMVNAPAGKMIETWEQDLKGSDYTVTRNLCEFVEYIDYVVNTRRIPCAVADVAYSNGGDLELVGHLSHRNLLFKLAAYAGWNTSSNTLGTAISQAFILYKYGLTQSHLDFLGLRYAEDVAYCSHVRKFVTDHLLSGELNYFKTDGKRGAVAAMVGRELQQFIQNILLDDEFQITINDLYMPWSRMFEVGLEISVSLKTKQVTA